MKNRVKSKWDLFTVLLFAFLMLFTLSLAFLLGWSLITSLKSYSDFRTNKIGFPKEWMFSNYAFIWNNLIVETVPVGGGAPVNVYFAELVRNTLLYVLGCAFLQATIPCLVAYVIAKFDFKLSGIIEVVALVVIILPITGAYTSEIQVLTQLGLYNHMIGMYIQKMNFTGMYFFVFIAAFRGLPKDIFEAAEIDGANEFSQMMRIGLPLSVYTWTTIFLIQAIAFWNDYQTVLLYLPSWPTLSYALYEIGQSSRGEWGRAPMQLAGSMFVLIPMVIIFAIFNKKIMGNITIGGVKG